MAPSISSSSTKLLEDMEDMPINDIPDDYSKGQMIGVGIAMLILPIVSVALRVWAKRLGGRGLRWDDYTLFIAALLAVVGAGLQIGAAVDGYAGQHQSQTANGQANFSDDRFQVYEKSKFALNLLHIIGLGFVKASILLLYMSIFPVKWFKRVSQILLGVCIAWSIAFFAANLFMCTPVTAFVEGPYAHDCIDTVAMFISISLTDPIIDVFILLLPVPMIMKLQLPWRQRYGVLIMFLAGIGVTAFAVARCILYFHIMSNWQHSNDLTYYTSPVFLWQVIELSAAVVSASLPTYRPVWKYLHYKIVSPHAQKPKGPAPFEDTVFQIWKSVAFDARSSVSHQSSSRENLQGRSDLDLVVLDKLEQKDGNLAGLGLKRPADVLRAETVYHATGKRDYGW